jgi:hypothetical protein
MGERGRAGIGANEAQVTQELNGFVISPKERTCPYD